MLNNIDNLSNENLFCGSYLKLDPPHPVQYILNNIFALISGASRSVADPEELEAGIDPTNNGTNDGISFLSQTYQLILTI